VKLDLLETADCFFFFEKKNVTYRFFAAFTWLSWTGLCAYFWAAGVQTFAYGYARNQQRRGREQVGKRYPLQRWPRFLQFLHVLLLSTVTTFRTYIYIYNSLAFGKY
jgi:uncharacterized membrane protein